MLPSSTLSPDQDMATIASSLAIMPRSPWLASLGCTKKAGVPVEANVAAIFWPTWPLLPMPVTMTRPLAAASAATAAPNGGRSCCSSDGAAPQALRTRAPACAPPIAAAAGGTEFAERTTVSFPFAASRRHA